MTIKQNKPYKQYEPININSIQPKEYYICINEYSMTTKAYILRTIKFKEKEISQYGITSIGLFGSYARDEQSENSDIDILIDFDPDRENFDNYMSVYDILENMFKNQRVDVVTKNGLSPYIGPKILKEVKYV